MMLEHLKNTDVWFGARCCAFGSWPTG